MSATLPAGPPELGLELGADVTVSDDGWLERDLVARSGLDGPTGILQGGLSAGVAVAIARLADRFGAPLSAVEANLHAPTPLGRTLTARVRASEEPARYEVETRDGDLLLVSAAVELAGHDPRPLVADLLELATVDLPPPVPQHAFPRCFVCGPQPTHPLGLRLHPRPYTETTVAIPWVAPEAFGDDGGALDPLLTSAVLDCPTVWASIGHVRSRGDVGALLASYQVRFYDDAPVMEPLRTVARMDEGDGRKIRARSALVDEEGAIHAVAAALHISVPEIPTLGAA